jgi:MFS family permease
MCGIFFSLGSLVGPSLGGFFIQFFQNISFFQILSALFLIIFLITLFKRDQTLLLNEEIH